MAPVRSSIIPASPQAGFSFRQVLEAGDVSDPHLSQDDLQRAERQAVRPVVATGAGTTLDDQTRPLEDAEVLGNRRPADIGNRGNLAGRPFTIPDQPQDLPAAGAGDRVHRVFQGNLAGSSSHLHSSSYLRDRKSTRLNSSHVSISY